MPEYKHLPIIDKWAKLKSKVNSQIDDWVKYEEDHPPESEYFGQYKFGYPKHERKHAPLYDVWRRMNDLDATEKREKWWVDAICLVCHGAAADYVMKCLSRGESHDPDLTYTGRLTEQTKSTFQEVLDYTVNVIYARYEYEELAGGAK